MGERQAPRQSQWLAIDLGEERMINTENMQFRREILSALRHYAPKRGYLEAYCCCWLRPPDTYLPDCRFRISKHLPCGAYDDFLSSYYRYVGWSQRLGAKLNVQITRVHCAMIPAHYSFYNRQRQCLPVMSLFLQPRSQDCKSSWHLIDTISGTGCGK